MMAARSAARRVAMAGAASGSQSLRNAATAAPSITYRQLPCDFCPDKLFAFNKTHGSTEHNFIPDGPVREHLGKIATGETVVWAAVKADAARSGTEDTLLGFLSAEKGGGYWRETAGGRDAVWFVNEFVVDPSTRGMGVGTKLAALSVDPVEGIFGIAADAKEMYTTVHVDNVGSRTAFIKAGYEEVLTYVDAARERNTTVLAKRP